MENKYIGEINDEELIDGALKGYVNALGDPYTTYYTKEEMKEIMEETNGNFVGIGIYMTENIKETCKVKYIRVVREDVQADGAYFENIKTAVEYLEKTTGNILITTGSKEIAKFSVVADRAFARVLPSEESLELCKNAGFKMKNIICMQGPFSKAFNSALIRELDIKYLVTKCTGKNGGFMEKTEAAKENGVECIIIKRPTDESGMTVSEVEKMILEWL